MLSAFYGQHGRQGRADGEVGQLEGYRIADIRRNEVQRVNPEILVGKRRSLSASKLPDCRLQGQMQERTEACGKKVGS